MCNIPPRVTFIEHDMQAASTFSTCLGVSQALPLISMSPSPGSSPSVAAKERASYNEDMASWTEERYVCSNSKLEWIIF